MENDCIQSQIKPEKLDYFTCPLSLERIKIGALTPIGTLYEKEFIEKWFEKNVTDPLTRIVIPKHYNHLIVISEEEMKDMTTEKFKEFKTKNIKFLPYNGVEYVYRINTNIMRDETLKLLTNINIRKETDNDFRLKYEIYLADVRKIVTREKQGYLPDSKQDFLINLNRPQNTGSNHQFLDLSNLTFEDLERKRNMFDGANVEDSIFINCDLTRTSWCYANLKGTFFISCNFAGEETIFEKARVSEETMFVNCVIEPIDSWNRTTEKEAFRKIVMSRGLPPGFKVR